MTFRRRHYEEVSPPAFLRVLYGYTGRIDAEIWRLQRIQPHRDDQRLHEVRQIPVPLAHGGARQFETISTVHALHSMQRHVIFPPLHDGVRHQRGSGQAAGDRQIRRGALIDARAFGPLRTTLHKPAFVNRDDDQARRSSLHSLDVLAEAGGPRGHRALLPQGDEVPVPVRRPRSARARAPVVGRERERGLPAQDASS